DGEAARCILLYSSGDIRTQRFFIDMSHPQRDEVLAVYEAVRAAHPQLISPGDIQAGGIQDFGVNARLQILYVQGWVGNSPDGKYIALKPGEPNPKIDFRESDRRHARDEQRLERMINYAGNSRLCRRVPLLGYFGQNIKPPCGNCDICAPEISAEQT